MLDLKHLHIAQRDLAGRQGIVIVASDFPARRDDRVVIEAAFFKQLVAASGNAIFPIVRQEGLVALVDAGRVAVQAWLDRLADGENLVVIRLIPLRLDHIRAARISEPRNDALNGPVEFAIERRHTAFFIAGDPERTVQKLDHANGFAVILDQKPDRLPKLTKIAVTDMEGVIDVRALEYLAHGALDRRQIFLDRRIIAKIRIGRRQLEPRARGRCQARVHP